VLACAEGVHTYLVRAPGHAWSMISVFVGLGGERVVRLVRAGSLDVRIEPYDPEWGISVRVDTACYWEPDETGRVRIDSLRPGEHQVFAQVGRLYDEVREVAVWIDALRTTEATIALGELPPVPEAVPLAGTIEVAAGWTWEDEAAPSCVTPSVSAWSVRDSIDVEGPDEDGRWSARDVRPGSYGFRLEAWPWIEAVEVGPEGATDVRLAVPPPCEVELRLVDEATGEPVLWEEAIAWYARAPDVGEEIFDCWSAHNHGRPAHPEKPGIYRFRAPRGILHAWVWDGTLDEPLRHGEVEAQLKLGLNRVELKVGWFYSADVVFRDGAMPVPLGDDFVGDVQVTSLQGGGAELERYEMRGGLRIHVTKTGRYRVSFPGIEGYEPIEPVEVDVAPGTIPRVEIALRRKAR
jgi:hypothetical protein